MAVQPFYSTVNGYSFNKETESFVKEDKLFEFDQEYPKPSEKEFDFGIQQFGTFMEYLAKNQKTEFRAKEFSRFLSKSLKKTLDVEPIIRYLNALGTIVFVERDRVIIPE